MRLNKKSLLLGMIVLLLSCIVGSSAKNSSFLENVQASMVQEKDSDQSQDQPEIGVSALGYCVMNADTGEIVLQKNADEKLHPASITKIMTLLVTVEQCKNLDSVTTVSENALNQIAPLSSTLHPMPKPGEQFTIRDLLYGLTMCSGNECANILAEAVCGDIDSFVELMNERAKEAGAKNTHFSNPHGLDADDHLTTAYDMALIMKAALKNPEAKEILSAKSSKYAPVTLNNIIHDIKAREGKFVIVGLPCHIHGLRKYEKIDKKFKDKVFAYFGLYCSGSKSFYLTEYVLDKYNINMKGLSYLSYRDEGCLGGMVAKGVDPQSKQSYRFYEDYQKYSHPLRSFFVPRRCLFCIDHFAELADISFGDIHVMPYSLDKVGINSLVTRKSGMTELLYEAASERAISLSDLNEDVLLSSQIAVKQKKQRASTFIKIDRILGRKVPKYDVKLDDSFVCRSVFSYGFNMLQQFVGNHKSLWSIISVLKKKTTID